MNAVLQNLVNQPYKHGLVEHDPMQVTIGDA